MTALVAVLLATLLGPPPDRPSEALTNSVTALAAHLVAEDPRTRARAEVDLLGLGPPATEPLLLLTLTADPAQLEAIRSILPKYGAAAVEPLLWASGRVSSNEQMKEQARDEAALAVVRIGPAARPELKRLLDSGYPSVPGGGVGGVSFSQAFALRVLRKMGPSGRQGIVELLSHPDPALRASAATLLANLADPRTADALLVALDSPHVSVRAEAARALGSLGDGRGSEGLLRLTRDSNAAARSSAVFALGRTYERRFLATLVKVARDDPEVSVRAAAASALIESSRDPVAVRLGLRYRPVSIDPVSEYGIRLGSVIRLVLTGLVIYVLLWASARRVAGERLLDVARSVWWSAAGLAAVGFMWGRVLRGLSGIDERLLLLVVVPVTALVAWLATPGLKVLRLPLRGLVVVVVLVVAAPLTGLIWGLFLIWAAPWLLAGLALATVIAAWWFGRRSDPGSRTPTRRVTVVGTAALYAGYGIGWLALWGQLGL